MSISLSIALAILFFYFGKIAYKNTKDIILNKVQINHSNVNGPKTKLNILQLSDLHLENISISSTELYDKLKHEKIDLIALTGDFLDRKRTIPKLVPYLKVLNQLDVKYGIYAVLGNHDYVLKNENLTKLINTLEQYNCVVMQNENRMIDVNGQRVNIIGIDDFSTKRSNLEKAYSDITEGTNIVLTHDPNVVLHMEDYHFDYLMAGHFHGGQICYPKAYHLAKMGKLARMNIVKGLHKQNGKPFYISEGLGQTGINIRVGSRPEITFHEFHVSSMEKKEYVAI